MRLFLPHIKMEHTLNLYEFLVLYAENFACYVFIYGNKIILFLKNQVLSCKLGGNKKNVNIMIHLMFFNCQFPYSV